MLGARPDPDLTFLERFLGGEMKVLPPRAVVGGVPCAPSPIVTLSAVVENGDGVSLDQQKVLAQKPKGRGRRKRRRRGEFNPPHGSKNTVGFLPGCS